MVDAARFRDSTQIVLPKGALDNYREALQQAFVVSIVEEGEVVRIVGSPVVIADVGEWLSKRGVVVE